MVEVRLSTINTNPYPERHPEWNRIKTLAETVDGPLYSDIPEDDFRKLLDIYGRYHNHGLSLAPIHFVFKIDSRIFAEWCMSPTEGGRNWNLHRDYQGEGFKDFVDNETQYAINRLQKKGMIGSPNISHVEYLGIREKVLEGLVKRAIELFSEWEGNSYPKDAWDKESPGVKKDKRNLRASLDSYIGF